MFRGKKGSEFAKNSVIQTISRDPGSYPLAVIAAGFMISKPATPNAVSYRVTVAGRSLHHSFLDTSARYASWICCLHVINRRESSYFWYEED